MARNILLVAPRFDKATEISFDIYESAKKKLNAKINLEGESVTRENFEKSLNDVSLIGFWDHGNDFSLIGNDGFAIVDEKNIHLLKDKEIFAIACLSSRKLGRQAVKEGILLWQGYNTPIIITSQPIFFYNFVESFSRGILERESGVPIWLCRWRHKQAFKKNIKDCINKGGTFFASVLEHDLQHLEYLR